ncbi:MAG: OadG family protein [Dehalococcoidia bacterium]|nr:MAG: OadG family protein [Dehalococcoidia bacterium]
MMLDGLFISLVGMGAVFISLTIIMFLMMGIERIFRSEELSAEEISVIGGEITTVWPVTARVEPQSQEEVAAIALALAAYMKERGKQIGQYIAIHGTNYQVEVGDTVDDPVSIVVNGEKYRGSLSDNGLSMDLRMGFRVVSGVGERKQGRIWRAAYPFLQGGLWTRHGWSGRHGSGRGRS